ncbi:hypothetical protein LVJ94_03210 [Pendulispora rubella]|uniref:LPXTG cell wall anchor domain-containing protein n=1 Tax=Pendulispora rubella TaxID=2741070 RepID=A0ABZ2LAN6_9BACT
MTAATGEVDPAVSRAGLTVAGWSKLDAGLRARTLSASAAATSNTMSIFVESKAPEITRADIEAAGGTVGTVAGHVLTARMASDAIAGIANSASVTNLPSTTWGRGKIDALAAMSDPRLPPPPAKKDSGGGCNVEPPGSALSGIVVMALGVGALLVRRRRPRS